MKPIAKLKPGEYICIGDGAKFSVAFSDHGTFMRERKSGLWVNEGICDVEVSVDNEGCLFVTEEVVCEGSGCR